MEKYFWGRKSIFGLVYILFLLISGIAHTEEKIQDFPNSSTYTLNKPVVEYPVNLDKVIETYSMETMLGYDAPPSELQLSALGFMTRIYIGKSHGHANNNKLIFAKTGLQIDKEIKTGILYQNSKEFILHIPFPTGAKDTVISFYFEGFSRSSALEIKNKIMNAAKQDLQSINLSPIFSSKSRFSFLPNFLFKDSFAAQLDSALPALCGGKANISTKSESGESSFLKNTWNCTKGIGSGVWDSTGGLVSDTAHLAWAAVKGTGRAIIHPVQTFEAASSEMKRYKAIFSDLDKALGSLKSAYNELPDEVKWKMGCEIVGQVGTTGLVSYLTVGAGSPAFLRVVSNSLLKVAAQLPHGSIQGENAMLLAGQLASRAMTVEARINPALTDDTRKSIEGLESKLKQIEEQRQAVHAQERHQAEIQNRIQELSNKKEKLNTTKYDQEFHEDALRNLTIFGMSPSDRRQIAVKLANQLNKEGRFESNRYLQEALEYETHGTGRAKEKLARYEAELTGNVAELKKLEKMDPQSVIDKYGISSEELQQKSPARIKDEEIESVKEMIEGRKLLIESEKKILGFSKTGESSRIISEFAKEQGVSTDQLLFAFYEMHDGKSATIIEKMRQLFNKSITGDGKKTASELEKEIVALKKQVKPVTATINTEEEVALQKKVEAVRAKLEIQMKDPKLSADQKSALVAYQGVTACRAVGTAISPRKSPKSQEGIK